MQLNPYKIAVILSSISMIFGILREFLIVGILGFTSENDNLQLYLSIFFTIGISIDAVRLSCLNLFNVLPLSRIIFAASIVCLPFSIFIGLIMSYSTGGLNNKILIWCILGSYLNLIAALLITYKQRTNLFLPAQIINIIPNFILIPGIIICYWLYSTDFVFYVVMLTSLIPVVQCILLLILPNEPNQISKNISLASSIIIFIRHFSAMIGEQMFQIIVRTAFYKYGTGYLSVFSMSIRIYSAARFILIDSFIGSKLAHWQSLTRQDFLTKIVNTTIPGILIGLLLLGISLQPNSNLLNSSFKIILILMFGFYFSTLVRIVYFKINRYETNPIIIMRFAIYELCAAFIALLVANQLNDPILALLWIGYIAKPFAQLLFLRKRYQNLEIQ